MTKECISLEEVLVVPAQLLFSTGYFYGMKCNNTELYLKHISESFSFIQREKAESDESYKQIIPYIVVVREKDNKVLLLERLNSQGEGRLHNKMSIGVGGHVNRCDLLNGKAPWVSGMERELEEELECNGDFSIEFVGLLNDDTVNVGRVHFGIVYKVVMHSGEVTIREQDKMAGKFADIAELKTFYPRLETWSQIVFDELFAI